ncbi:SWIM zinc finger family protein [Streptomyces sp. WMMC1477]|uniref:SWIM zinc finger family protein n=1 Tax=Streptomyces sp. WMMC1477 TaxID=3015155 RepID=UPI0022B70B4E|nr:SWF or SNF family helicase [Streptomyces sp. WMMC1477]MCZ7434541.1 SWF or SNF family helicase [Streptomyces sp. WMMC1477]
MSTPAEGFERVLSALPPARGRRFAATWWGERWLGALEDGALEPEHLRAGRRLARAGAVGAVSARPGRITAVVQDRDGTGHRCDIQLPAFDGHTWDRLVDVVSAEAGHVAALLDRDLPTALAQDAEAAGVELLPGIGELEPTCECGAWDHCPHSAALGYHWARLLDGEPFLLLLLRGRAERELVAGLQHRAAVRAAAGSTAEDVRGTPAARVYAAAVPPLPGTPPEPPAGEAGPPIRWGGGRSPGEDIDPQALEFLAVQAAGRARLAFAEALDPRHADVPPPPEPTLGQDARRLAAARPGERILRRLAPVLRDADGASPDRASA